MVQIHTCARHIWSPPLCNPWSAYPEVQTKSGPRPRSANGIQSIQIARRWTAMQRMLAYSIVMRDILKLDSERALSSASGTWSSKAGRTFLKNSTNKISPSPLRRTDRPTKRRKFQIPLNHWSDADPTRRWRVKFWPLEQKVSSLPTHKSKQLRDHPPMTFAKL